MPPLFRPLRRCRLAVATCLVMACGSPHTLQVPAEDIGAVAAVFSANSQWAVSPDGRWLAFQAGDAEHPEILVRDLTSRQLIRAGQAFSPPPPSFPPKIILGVCWTLPPPALIVDGAYTHATFDLAGSPPTWTETQSTRDPRLCHWPSSDEAQAFMRDQFTIGRFEIDQRGKRVRIRDRTSGRELARHSGSIFKPGQRVFVSWADTTADGAELAYIVGREWGFMGPDELRVVSATPAAQSALLGSFVFGARWLPNGDMIINGQTEEYLKNGGSAEPHFFRIQKATIDRALRK